MAGRVLEIAGQAKLGKGESSVRFTERNKASKRVRDGMATKQKDRTQKVLEEVCVARNVEMRSLIYLVNRLKKLAITILHSNKCMIRHHRSRRRRSEKEVCEWVLGHSAEEH